MNHDGCPCTGCMKRDGVCHWDALRERAGLLPSVPVPPADAPVPPKHHSDTDREVGEEG
jgi:hypothetical protein